MIEVGLGTQSQVPVPRRPDEELLSAPMTREFIRSFTTEELIVVVPHSRSGAVPMSSLSGVGQLGFWEIGKGGTIG
jgi:hypothetical protein